MEKEFKVGDKVKIPKSKSTGYPLTDFEQRFKNFLNKEYFYIAEIRTNEYFISNFLKEGVWGYNAFSKQDLEHYEENINKMEKTAKLSLEVARQMYKNNNSAIRMFALENYSKEELEIPNFPIKWENLKSVKGYYISSHSAINPTDTGTFLENKNTFPTESLAKGALALAQLLQLRNAWWNGWEPWEQKKLNDAKYAIYFEHSVRGLWVSTAYTTSKIFTFKTEEIAIKFKETFKDLLWEAREYL